MSIYLWALFLAPLILYPSLRQKHIIMFSVVLYERLKIRWCEAASYVFFFFKIVWARHGEEVLNTFRGHGVS